MLQGEVLIMTVTFCGHADIDYDESIEKQLYDIIENLINNGADEFLLGGYGNFDNLAARLVRKLKNKYLHIESILVIPYLDKKYCLKMYDNTVYPPLETVPLRYAISKRNQWTVENSDCLVSYVKYTWGGAYKTLTYARKKKKHIINICR